MAMNGMRPEDKARHQRPDDDDRLCYYQYRASDARTKPLWGAKTLMTESFPYIDIILLAMFAGFIALRLRSVLGRRTGQERRPPEDVQSRYTGEAEDAAAAAGDVTLGMDDVQKSDYRIEIDTDSNAFRQIEAIRKADPGFDPEQFAAGARWAYDLILNSFWTNDLEELRPFVSDAVYQDFSAAAKALADDGCSFENSLERVRKIEFDDASIEDNRAEITLRFVSDVRLVTKDSEGRVIAGNPVDETEVIDVWTFERDLTSTDPNWTLIATTSD